MLKMLIPLTEYSKVVNEYLHEMPEQIMENITHYPPECAWSIAEPKGHSSESVRTPISGKGCINLVSLSDKHLIVA